MAAVGPMEAARRPDMARLAPAGMRAPGAVVLRPDRRVADGDGVAVGCERIEVVHLPGRTPDHLAFAWRGADLTADALMGWSPTMLAPPDGNLAAHIASRARLAGRRPYRHHLGRGEPGDDPARRIGALLDDRRDRGRVIAAELGPDPRNAATIARAVYGPMDPALAPAAEAKTLAHLFDLA